MQSETHEYQCSVESSVRLKVAVHWTSLTVRGRVTSLSPEFRHPFRVHYSVSLTLNFWLQLQGIRMVTPSWNIQRVYSV